MSVSLVFDRWSGIEDRGEVVEDPEEIEVAAAIERLDGAAFTLATLVRGPDEHLAIGGGPERCFLYWTNDNQRFWKIVGDPHAEAEVLLNIGGQTGHYPRRHLVSKATALEAALEYLRDGQRLSSVLWEY